MNTGAMKQLLLAPTTPSAAKCGVSRSALLFYPWRACLKLLLLALGATLLVASTASATTYYSRATGNWSSTSTWSTSHGGSAGTAVPGSGDTAMIEGGYTVTNDTAAQACTTLYLGSTTSGDGAGTISFDSGSQLTVGGIVYIGQSSIRTGSINMANGGTLICQGFTLTDLGTWTPGAGTVQLTATSTLPTSGLTTFNNFTVTAGTTTLGVSISVNGTLTQSGGNIAVGSYTLTVNGTHVAGTGTVSGSGTYTLASGATLQTANTSGINGTITTTIRNLNAAANYTLNGSAAQVTGTYLPTTLTGTLTIANGNGTGVTLSQNTTITSPGSCVVNNGALLTLGPSIILSGTGAFTLSSGGTLAIGNASGINGNITESGTKTFSTGANYIYNGTAAQVTGSSLPATVNNLTINTSAGVTLTAGTAVSGTLTQTSGNIAVGSNTLTVNGTHVAGTYTVSGAGGYTLASGATLQTANTSGINGTITTTTRNLNTAANYTFNGTAAQVTGSYLPATVNNLTVSTTGGALTISTAGVTAVTGTFAIGSGSQVSLAAGYVDTAGSLTLGGTSQAVGTYGGTGSPAGTINTAYFAATTGIVSVGAPRLIATLPGETFTSGSGNSGSATAQAAGTSFNITLTAVDASNNQLTGYTGSHTVSYSGPANSPGGNTPTYTTTVTFSSGQATSEATTLVDAQSTTITATISGLTGVASSSLTVNPATASKLVMKTEPSSSVMAGGTFSPQPAVYVEDAYGNVVTSDSSSKVTTTVQTGTGPLTGSTTATASGGVATFSGLAAPTTAQTGLELTFTDSSTGSPTVNDTTSITVNAGTASKLAITSVPASATAGVNFSVTVQSQDANGNPANVVASTGISLGSSGAGTLSGNTGTISAGANSVTLASVQNPKAETITLTASRTSGDSLAASAASSSIQVKAGAATQTRVETAANGSGSVVVAANVTAGTSITVYAISRDAQGNFVANPSATWSLQNISGGVVSGDLVGGGASAVFTGHLVGSANIQAVASGFTGQSGVQTVIAGAATTIALTSGNSQSGAVGTALASPFAVTVTDASGNPKSGTSVTFAVDTAPSGATGQSLSSTSATTDGNGQASSTLTLGTLPGTYTVKATSSGLSGSPVTFTATGTVGSVAKLQVLLPGEVAAPGTDLGKTGTPTAQVAGTAITGGIVVNAVDAYWNVVSTATPNVVITSSDTNAVVADDNGDTAGQVTLVAGTATLSSFTFKTAGTNTITATDAAGVLTADESAAVEVDPGAFVKLQVLVPGETADPGTETGKAGTAAAQTTNVFFEVVVNAVDADWNVVSTNDTVTFTSTDTAAQLPADAALVSGTGTFSLALNTMGNSTVTASDVTDGSIESATSASIAVMAYQTITFGALGDKTYGDAPFDVSATADSGLAVSFSIVSGPATNNGTTITLTGVGQVVVQASQAGDTFWHAAAPVNQSFTVNPKTVTPTVTLNDKVYDGTTAATTIATRSLSGIVDSDDVSLGTSGTVAAFGSRNVGLYTPSVTDLSLSGSTAGNYVLSTTSVNPSASITACPLTVTAHANSKTYDGGTSAATAPDITSGAVQTGDTANFTEAYDTKDVGTSKKLTPSGTVSDGNSGNNYTYNMVTANTGTITPKALTMGGLTVSPKVYDGTTKATLGGAAALTGSEAAGAGTSTDGLWYTGDGITLGGTAVGTFGSKDVGSPVSVTVSGNTLVNNGAGDYTLTQQTGLSANITPKALNYTGISAANKVYDGTTTASLSGVAAALAAEAPGSSTSDGAPYTGDTVSFTTGTLTGSFASKGVGKGIAVTVTGGVTLAAGGQSADYSVGLPQPALTADITPTAVAITGTVAYYPSTYPTNGLSDTRVAGVTINLAGYSTASTNSGTDGTYALTNVPVGGAYSVTPSLASDAPPNNGITSADLALIQAHILLVKPLDSPYKLLAADVNGSGTITAGDLAAIQRVVLGISNTFMAGLWRFVPADYIFPDTNQPWSAPTSRSFPNPVWDITNQDFVAIKLGDVNNSWPLAEGNALRAPGLVLPAVVVPAQFQVSNQTPNPGDTFKASILVSGFQKVTSAQFTLQWDPAVLRYVGTGDYGLGNLGAGSFGTQAASQGTLAFSWYDMAAKGVTLADGTTIFTVSFQVVGGAATVSRLALVDTPTVREVTEDFVETAFAGVNGRVRVAGGNPVSVSGSGYAQGVFSLSVQTTSGWLYSLEYKNSLNSTNWTLLPGVVEGDGTVQILTDPGASSPQRFYRVQAE